MVRPGIWALLLTHYAIRDLMRRAADDIEFDPDRLSFTRSLHVIRRQDTDQAGFPPERLAWAINNAKAEINERPNPARRHRTYPRVIKRHSNPYCPRNVTPTV